MIFRVIEPGIYVNYIRSIDAVEKPFRIERFVQSFSITKNLKQPVHSFQLTLSPVSTKPSGDNFIYFTEQSLLDYWQQVIRKYCLISCTINIADDENYTFLGLVDQAFPTVTSQNSASKSFQVNCSLLLPKLLMSDRILVSQSLLDRNDPLLREVFGEKMEAMRYLRGLDPAGRSPFINRNPGEAIEYILANMISVKDVWRFNPDGSPGEKAEMDQYLGFRREDSSLKKFPGLSDEAYRKVINISTLKSEVIFNPELSVFQGTTLQYINSVIDNDFYEHYYETITLKKEEERKLLYNIPYNSINIRPIPFSYRNLLAFKRSDPELDVFAEEDDSGWTYWDDLDRIDFTSEMRLSENLSENDKEIFNYFETQFINSVLAPPGSSISTLGYNFPIVNLDSVRQFGLRPLKMKSIAFLNFDGIAAEFNEKGAFEPDPGFSKRMKDSLMVKRDKAVEWYCYPHFETGQITAIADPAYQVGKILRYRDKPYSIAVRIDGKTKIYEGTGMEYYISGVQYMYSAPGIFVVNLSLTRGQPLLINGENLVTKYYKANRRSFIDATERIKDMFKSDFTEEKERAGKANEQKTINKTIKEPEQQ